MDELELLKKDWQKDDNNYPKKSYNEIYKMILKKSSSIVKWILIISILEFMVLRGTDLFMLLDEKYKKEMVVAHLYNFEVIITILRSFISVTIEALLSVDPSLHTIS